MCNWKKNILTRFLLVSLSALMVWTETSPAFATSVQVDHEIAMQYRERTFQGLPAGMTDIPNAQQRKAIEAKANAKKPVADVRRLSASEMAGASGRGGYRNAAFSGLFPWQRSFRDVNVCTGNLMKSFTDFQVAPARGAGLAMQRTYNSNDSRIGPFGVGWTQAYDIHLTELGNNQTGSTGFVGSLSKYHRDADGLYTPPNYKFDQLSSDYENTAVNGPISDTDVDMSGTTKHYFSNGSERDCDYIQDRFGNQTTLAYNQTVTLADGSTKKLLSTVTDPSGRSLVYTWSNLGTTSQPSWRITQIQGPLDQGAVVAGVTYRVTYDYYTDTNDPNAADNLYNLKAAHVDPDGLNRTTSYTYTHVSGNLGTENALLATITDPLSRVLTYNYFSNPDNTDPAGRKVVFISNIVEPSGVTSSNANQFTTWTLTWTVGSEGVGTPLMTADSHWPGGGGLAFRAFCDWQYRILGLEEGLGQGWHHWIGYDSQNNPLNIQVASGGGITSDFYTYGQHGNVMTHYAEGFAPTDQASWFDADKYFQKSSVTDMNGHTTTMEYGTSSDANTGNRGNVLTVRDARYATTGAQYTYTYNQYGQKLTETNENGIVTQFAYGDAWGNLTKIVQDVGTGHLNRTSTMAYDAAGRVFRSRDPNGYLTTFQYNVLGQPTIVSVPSTSAALAEAITYSYGTDGRTESETDNRGTTSLTYENNGDRIHSVSDPITGTTTYTYTLLGSKQTATLPGGGTVTYNYVPLTSSDDQYPDGEVIPDDNPDHITERLANIVDDQGRKVEYNIVNQGLISSVKSNEVYSGSSLVSYLQTDYVYDRGPFPSYTDQTHDWLTDITTTFHSTSTSTTTVVAKNHYTYDNTGQRLTNQITDSAGVTRTEQYGYDELNRLTSVDYGLDANNDTGSDETQSYTFDPMGNRTQMTDTISGASSGNGTTTHNYTVDAINRLTQVDSNTYTNDLNGNTLTGGGRTLSWDDQNRMVKAVMGGGTTTYRYGSDGLRRSSTAGATTTNYAVEGTNMVREMQKGVDNLQHPTATYLIGARGPEYRRNDTTGDIRWYVYDGLGSVVAEVDPLGNVTAGKKYDAYGATRAATGTGTTKQGFVGALGHQTDSESGLVYMQARYYDPAIGRFANEDPEGSGINWFVYCDNNPTNLADPTGEDPYLLHLILQAIHDHHTNFPKMSKGINWKYFRIMLRGSIARLINSIKGKSAATGAAVARTDEDDAEDNVVAEAADGAEAVEAGMDLANTTSELVEEVVTDEYIESGVEEDE